MITHIQGKLSELLPSVAVIDCNGIGYKVNISLTTYSALGNEENVKLYTYHHIREDQQTLFGFRAKRERALFERLISVNGVGPSSALMMLSTLNAEEIIAAITGEQVKVLVQVKGIGAKTAQRIIIDLKDKLEGATNDGTLQVVSENKIKFEALSALETLGIPKKAAELQIQKLLKATPNLQLEDLIKQTLKNI